MIKEIKLRSKNYEITKLNRKTTAKGFCDLKIGDVIYFETVIKRAGRNGNSLYASSFICINTKTNICIREFTHNESSLYLSIFELKEVENEKNENNWFIK